MATRLPTTRRTWLLALAGVVSLYLLWGLTAYHRGVAAAKVDGWRGHDEFQTFGYPSPVRPEYARLLVERYGVRLNVVAGCVVSGTLVDYVSGYNATVRDRLRKRHGRDVGEECWAEAKARWRAKNSRGEWE